MDIDICIVNYHVDDLIKLNIDFLNEINCGHGFSLRFIVGENSPYKYDASNLIRTPPVDRSEAEIKPGEVTRTAESFAGNNISSMHHSLSMERCIAASTARYVVLMDADYFLLKTFQELIRAVTMMRVAAIGCKNFSSVYNVKLGKPRTAPLPITHFLLIDRDVYKEEIVISPRRADPQYYYWDDMPDTGLPFRLSLYKYRYQVFDLCINPNCTICKETVPPLFMKSIVNPRKPEKIIERSFYNGGLCGIHYHYRSGEKKDLEQIKNTLDQRLLVKRGQHNSLLVD